MTLASDPISGGSIERRLKALATLSDAKGEMTRLTLSPAHRRAAEWLSKEFRSAGMDVYIDAMGTLIGRYGPANRDRSTLVIGSHIDTVRNAGIYDGNLGVIIGLAAIDALNRDKIALPFNIELAAFGDEEGLRFPSTLTGSKAMAGRGDRAWLEEKDSQGVSRGDALSEFGAPAEPLARCALDPRRTIGYVEVHIEQGPVLESEGLPVGIVTGISGATRALISLRGKAGHAGTLPMALRHDAMTAAADMILAIEARARKERHLVATVGMLTIENAAANVVPGRVSFSLDLRAVSNETRMQALEDIRAMVSAVGESRGVETEFDIRHTAGSTLCDPGLSEIFSHCTKGKGVAPYSLHSGAGHDAMAFDGVTPIGMLFVRCRGGVSHSPLEYASPGDMQIAGEILIDFIRELAVRRGDAASLKVSGVV